MSRQSTPLVNETRRKYNAMSEYLCNLIVPGAAKSGTSSLHGVLGRHPQICMSQPSEPQFFSFDDLYQKGVDAHNSLFDNTKNYDFYGEKSQCYFVHRHAMERIRRDLDSPKIILLLREPVERLLSHYRWRYKRGWEKRPLLKAIAESGNDTTYEFDSHLKMFRGRGGGYIAFSRYSEYVPRWQKAFGEEKVLLLRTEDLKHNQQKVASRCFEFIGVSDFSVGDTIRRNTTAAATPPGFEFNQPWYTHALASLVPQKLKANQYYERAKQNINSILKNPQTPTPPTISGREKTNIRRMLSCDIEFHNSIRNLSTGQ